MDWVDQGKYLDMRMEDELTLNEVEVERTSKMMFNRSNSFPVSICSNNEESYVVNFDQIMAMEQQNEMNTYIQSIRDPNSIFLDDHIGFIGSKETNSYFDNSSKFQKSATTDFSSNLKYLATNNNLGLFVNSNATCSTPVYSRSSSDLSNNVDKSDNSSDYSLNRGSESTVGSLGLEYGSNIIKNGSSRQSSLSPTNSIPPGSIVRYKSCDLTPEDRNKNDRNSTQSFSFSSLTTDQLRDIGFINKQSNRRRSKRGCTPVKLFVNRVPKHMTSEELLSIFNKYGIVVECNIIKDSNGPRGCAFIRFSNIYEAQHAILCIHGKTVLDKEVGPIQVKYADGEIERLGLSPDVQPCGESVKVFVGSLPKNCTEDQLLLLFKQFGHVDEVHIIRDNNKQSKCSAFVTFPRKFMAENAIMFLDKKYIFDNSKRPIEVRLAKSRAKQRQNQTQDQTYIQSSQHQLNINGMNFFDSNNNGNFSLGRGDYGHFDVEMNKQLGMGCDYDDISAISDTCIDRFNHISERVCNLNGNFRNMQYNNYIGTINCSNAYIGNEGFKSVGNSINVCERPNSYVDTNQNSNFHRKNVVADSKICYQTYSDYNLPISNSNCGNSTHSETDYYYNDTTYLSRLGGKTSIDEYKQLICSSDFDIPSETGRVVTSGIGKSGSIQNEEDFVSLIPSNLIDLRSKPILNI